MIVSKETDRNVPVLQTYLPNGDSHGIFPSTSSAVYIVEQTAERIPDESSAVLPVTDVGGNSDSPRNTAEVSASRSFVRDEDSLSSTLPQMVAYIQHDVAAPSVISQHELPTYTQASLSEEGVSPSGHPSPASEFSVYLPDTTLPDILYSHITPRLPPASSNQHRQQRHRHDEGHSRGSRHRHRVHVDGTDRQRRHSSWTRSTSSSQLHEGSCKEPCVKCMVTVTSFRWVLVVLSVLGVACVVTGIVLASLHAAGQSFLFLAIMFIGLGVLLVIVVGVGWKCTPRGHEPLHALFGIGGFIHRRSRGRRHRRHRNRDRNWIGGMMYPEFQFRRPPPSYAASMQDYHSQVTPERNASSSPGSPVHSDRVSPPNSPPPSYRSRISTCHSGILNAFPNINNENETTSRPPTYRSHTSTHHRPSFPREYRFEHDRPDPGLGISPPQETPSSVYLPGPIISSTAHHNHEPTVSSELSSPSHLPVSGPAVLDELSNNLSSSTQPASVAAEDQSLSPERTTEASNHGSQNTHNVIADAAVLASTFALESDNGGSPSSLLERADGARPSSLLERADGARPSSLLERADGAKPSSLLERADGAKPSSLLERADGARPSSLLERMNSEDRLILEETLQSIDRIDDSGGITNQGAVFDDLTQ